MHLFNSDPAVSTTWTGIPVQYCATAQHCTYEYVYCKYCMNTTVFNIVQYNSTAVGTVPYTLLYYRPVFNIIYSTV